MFITENEKVNSMLTHGAKKVMTLEQIIATEISEWDNSPVKNDMMLGHKYYRNEHGKDIVSGFIRKLSKQKTDYLLAKPFSIDAKNKAYLELLNTVFDAKFRKTLKQVGTQAVNKGIGWLQVYFENNEIAFRVIPSEEVIPLWIDAAHTKLDGLIRTYRREEYEGMSKKWVRHVEYWDATGVKRYIYDNYRLTPDVELGATAFHFAINKEGYNWQRVPFIAFKYNDDELPLIKGLKGAVDDYDAQKNVVAKLLQDIPNFIYVLKNYGGQDLAEFLSDLKKFKAIKVDEDGGVDKLQADINIDAYDVYMQQARKDIYEFGRGVDTQAVDLGDASGQALKFRYADLDTDCNDMESEFLAGMQDVIWFVNQYFFFTKKGDFTKETVGVTFNRDTIINETETIQQCANSKDVVSDETILTNHPWVADVTEELKRLEKQRKDSAVAKRQGFGVIDNTPPGDDEE